MQLKMESGNNPRKIIGLDRDTDDGDLYVLTTDLFKREALQMFKPTQIKPTITPNAFTAQSAGQYSNAGKERQLWNGVLFDKHVEITLELLENSLGNDVITVH